MNHDMRWVTIPRENLVDLLLDEDIYREYSTSIPLNIDEQNKLAIGYKKDNICGEWKDVPAVVVLGDKSIIEILSWIRVYADDVFPISQFARVVQQSDWNIFGRQTYIARTESFWPSRWASVAVGETLGQSETEVDLKNMPLSRIASSLSLPMGRTESLFGRGEPTRVCVERLRAVSEDIRFGRRAVGVDQLIQIWTMCGTHIEGNKEPEEAVDIVLSTFASILDSSSIRSLTYSAGLLDDYGGLQSDSVEERVMAFTKLAQYVSSGNSVMNPDIGAAMLAAGCFLVGRGTSHAFLLRRFQNAAPPAFAWFGLIAALSGPRCWDGPWLRAVKGAERLLRADFSWGDTPSADIGWSEFSWLAGVFDDVQHLTSLPKMLPRTLGWRALRHSVWNLTV